MSLKLTDAYKTPNAVRFVFRFDMTRWREDDPFVRDKGPRPTLASVAKYLRRRPHRRLFLVKNGRTFIGLAMIHKNNEVGIALLPAYRELGFGTEAMQMMLDREEPLHHGTFRARIHPSNLRSIRLFQRLGFQHTDNIYTLHR